MSESEPGCIYEKLDNGIHKFIFTGKGEDGMDVFFTILEGILRSTPTDTTLRYIVDNTRSGKQGSMMELVRRFRKLESRIPERAAGRTAIIHNPDILITLADTFVSTLAPSKDKTRFFTPDRMGDAIKWVLSDR